jgi:hypothetical protein
MAQWELDREDPSSGKSAMYVAALCPLTPTDLFPLLFLSYSKYDAKHDESHGVRRGEA